MFPAVAEAIVVRYPASCLRGGCMVVPEEEVDMVDELFCGQVIQADASKGLV